MELWRPYEYEMTEDYFVNNKQKEYELEGLMDHGALAPSRQGRDVENVAANSRL